MKSSKNILDMTQGSILKNLFRFSIPLMLASFLQLLYNAADIVVVSRWTGSEAMASVGATSSLTNLLVNFFIGASVGVSVVVSRRFGANDEEGLQRAVHTSILLSVFMGIGAFLVGEIFCKPSLLLMGTPDGDVLNGAILYMRIILCGVPASIIYNFGSAVLRSVGDTKRSLYILSASGIVNVILNLIFVICFSMGVAGVALATIISQYLSVVLLIYTLTKTDDVHKIYLKKLKINKSDVSEIIKIGIPAGIQSILFNFANTVIQSAVNSFGAAAMAGNSAASNVEGFAFVVKNAFCQATVTAVSQNYGAKNEERIKKSIYVNSAAMAAIGVVVGVLITVFAKQILGIYITDSEEALNYGITRLTITTLPYFLSGIVDILAGYLRGVGYSTLSTVDSFVGAIAFRMVWVFIIFPKNRVFEMLYLCWPISWVLIIVLQLITIALIHKHVMIKMYES